MHTILSDHLERYLEGRLPAGVQSSVDNHLAECHSCQAELDEAMESSKLLRLLAVGEDDATPEPLPGFSLKVMQGIEAAS